MDPFEELMHWLRPSWAADALCREFPELSWHPVKGQRFEEQLRICSRCAVRRECYGAAMANEERYGVWGGTSAASRLAIFAAAATAAA